MSVHSSTLLTWLIVLPLIGGLLTLLAPSDRSGRAVAWIVGLVVFLLSLGLLGQRGPGYAFVQNTPWIAAWGVNYHLGVDGISAFLVPLATLVSLVALVASGRTGERPRQQWALLLLLEAATVGVFVSLDLFLFYIFWELMLVPVYLLMVGWGGPGGRPAAVKFLIYSLVGSLFMLVGIVYLGFEAYQATGTWSFELARVQQVVPGDLGTQLWLFGAFALAFAIKAPLFPFHTWSPDAYAEAPAPTAAVLAGVLSKAGIYGFLRLAIPLFPLAVRTLWPAVAVLAVVAVLYGALIALRERDMRRLLAYVSVSHLGLMVLGAFAGTVAALDGVVVYMVAHGLFSAGLFLLVGMLEARTGTRDLEALGGLARSWPILAGAATVIVMGTLGLPGLAGFSGEFLILLGVFQVSPVAAVFAICAVVLAGAYMLRFFQRALQGPAPEPAPPHRDLCPAEVAVLLPLIAGLFWFGLSPGAIARHVAPAATPVVRAAGHVAALAPDAGPGHPGGPGSGGPGSGAQGSGQGKEVSA